MKTIQTSFNGLRTQLWLYHMQSGFLEQVQTFNNGEWRAISSEQLAVDFQFAIPTRSHCNMVLSRLTMSPCNIHMCVSYCFMMFYLHALPPFPSLSHSEPLGWGLICTYQTSPGLQDLTTWTFPASNPLSHVGKHWKTPSQETHPFLHDNGFPMSRPFKTPHTFRLFKAHLQC